MNPFRSLNDAEPALSNASLLKAALLTIDYIENNGAIGLTAAKAFKRHFVAWAAEAFHWPDYTTEDLYAVNKVLNEHDFPPLMILHEILLSAKLARHLKGAMHLTKLARLLRSRPAQLWTLLATHLLFVLDHGRHSRSDEPPIGNWDIFLNVINVEAQTGVTEERLCSVLYGGKEEDIRRYDYKLTAAFHVHVLRPLCWAGLLDEHRTGSGLARQEIYTKTALWQAAFKLETDVHLKPVALH